MQMNFNRIQLKLHYDAFEKEFQNIDTNLNNLVVCTKTCFVVMVDVNCILQVMPFCLKPFTNSTVPDNKIH